jgi:hypothetical protein
MPSDSAAAGIPAMQDPARSELEATQQKLQQVQEIAGELAGALTAVLGTIGMLDASEERIVADYGMLGHFNILAARALVSRARALGLMGE